MQDGDSHTQLTDIPKATLALVAEALAPSCQPVEIKSASDAVLLADKDRVLTMAFLAGRASVVQDLLAVSKSNG